MCFVFPFFPPFFSGCFAGVATKKVIFPQTNMAGSLEEEIDLPGTLHKCYASC